MAVAYSGGRDSTALLHATLARAAALGVQVIALHVHHGLSPQADAWLAHCEAQCRRWSRGARQVEFAAQRLNGSPARGESVEAWARAGRYAALRAMAVAHGVSLVWLAHHRRDQAETLLLQALRGAGVAGLACMPHRVQRDGITWQRPWLDKPLGEIEAYVRRHRLKHIDDDSNGDDRFARNRLRHRVWPALTGAFAQAEASLAASAAWAQQADAALGELAAIDLARIASPAGLQRDAWLELSTPRRSNALRAWVKGVHGASAPASLIARLLAEMPARRTARWPLGASGDGNGDGNGDGDAVAELRLYRGWLTRAPAAAPPKPVALRETHLAVATTGRHALPGWRGHLLVEPVPEGGVPMAWLARLELRPRGGAERFQSAIGRPPRSLKKQYQEAGVPAWARNGPLLYSGGQLVFVAGLGLDARVVGLPGQRLVNLRWEPVDA